MNKIFTHYPLKEYHKNYIFVCTRCKPYNIWRKYQLENKKYSLGNIYGCCPNCHNLGVLLEFESKDKAIATYKRHLDVLIKRKKKDKKLTPDRTTQLKKDIISIKQLIKNLKEIRS